MDIETIKSACPVYFSRDTMRFFRSRVHSDVYPAPDGTAYFVTSERRDDDEPRLYSVRRFHPEANGERARIETLGTFQGYASRNGAHGAARRFARDGFRNEPCDMGCTHAPGKHPVPTYQPTVASTCFMGS